MLIFPLGLAKTPSPQNARKDGKPKRKSTLSVPSSPETKISGLPVFSPCRMGVVLLLVLAIAGAVDLTATDLTGQKGSLSRNGLATISTPSGAVIYAEIADTPAKHAEGLMFRTTLEPDHGMLFTFQEPGQWTFWMKNTKMPLDIIWLDAKGKVVHLESNVPICTRNDDGCPRYHPFQKALYVLELKAGIAESLQIQKGTQLAIVLP